MKEVHVWLDEEDIAEAARLLIERENWLPKGAEIIKFLVSGRVDVTAKVPSDWEGKGTRTSWDRLRQEPDE